MLSKSALIRMVRTLLQVGLAWLTVDRVEAWVLAQDLSTDVKTLAIGLATAALAFLHRQFVDPSPLPSLVDRDALAGVRER